MIVGAMNLRLDLKLLCMGLSQVLLISLGLQLLYIKLLVKVHQVNLFIVQDLTWLFIWLVLL
jgi:hypothetical protein